jgi:hypothetical protein
MMKRFDTAILTGTNGSHIKMQCTTGKGKAAPAQQKKREFGGSVFHV